jgi:hypothetical protein
MISKLVVDFDAPDAVPEALDELKGFITANSRIIAGVVLFSDDSRYVWVP